ncbi:MAG: AAA family ATPase, partial [Archaeoglobus sp.]
MSALSKLAELKLKLADLFVQREAEITAVLSGLISGEPTILIGEAGTAKTILIEKMAELIDAKYFYYLLTRFTEPDEVLGPLDINALRDGKYVRRTDGRLPEAEIVFLDEIFKASSAIRNILLDIILNRRFRNNGGYSKLPMLTMYTASNEVSSDAEDAAFYDRLTVRCFVKSVSEDAWSELVERGIVL